MGRKDDITGSSVWQEWEIFVAKFRVLKSQLFSGGEVSFEKLHQGALMGPECDTKVAVPNLDLIQRLHKRVLPADGMTMIENYTRIYSFFIFVNIKLIVYSIASL